jgi:hypothetical protein
MNRNLHLAGATLSALSLLAGCTGFSGGNGRGTSEFAAHSPDENDSPRPDQRKPKIEFEASLSHGDNLTFGTARVSAATMLPLDPPNRMLLIKPSFAAHTLDSELDTPSQLFSAGINAMWLERLNDHTAMTFAVSPSVGGDDAEFGRNVRVFAMGAVTWDYIPDELKLTAGAAWLGRRDIGVVPAAGVEWTPNDEWNIALILPRPRIARRLSKTEISENWLYATGSINGGSFDVRRLDGTPDELSLTEFQTAVGFELTNRQIGRGFFEIGAGFGRQIQYELNAEEVEFDPSVVLRMGLTR